MNRAMSQLSAKEINETFIIRFNYKKSVKKKGKGEEHNLINE